MGFNFYSLHQLVMGRSSVNSQTPIPILADPYTGAQIVIESEHAHIHTGRGFQLSGEIASVASAQSVDFYVAPAQGIHFRDYRFSANGAPIKVGLYENPTLVVTGSQLSPINRNRFSTKVSSTGIFVSGSASAIGTFMDLTRIEGIGTGANVTGEIEGFPVEWVLNNSNTYLMRITNEDNAAVKITYRMFWYELGL